MGFRRGPAQSRPSPSSASLVQWVAVLALVVYIVGLAGLVATGAQADEPGYEPPSFFAEPDPAAKPCPAAPEPLADPPPPSEGEEPEPDPDPLRRELRLQRIEAAEVCEAQATASREIQRRLWWAVAELRPNSALLETTNERVSQLLDASCGNPCATYAEGGQVEVTGFEGGSSEFSEAQLVELVSSIDASGEASSGALYFLAGLIVSCFVGYCFWRSVQNAT